jgi:hypothetical protein
MNDERSTLTATVADTQTREPPTPVSSDPDDLARYLCAAHAAGAEVDFRRVDRKRWGLALESLLYLPALDVAATVAPALAAEFPEVTYFETMAEVFRRLPEANSDATVAAFRDDVGKEVQVVRCPGASVVVLGFCGSAQKMGLPLNVIHRWMGRLGRT